jgi:putative membrane protein
MDRTVLANERTLLAYVRTALTLFLVGISLVHLPDLHPDPGFGGPAYDVGGWLFVGSAAVLVAIGSRRYRQFKAEILDIQLRG